MTKCCIAGKTRTDDIGQFVTFPFLALSLHIQIGIQIGKSENDRQTECA